MGFVQFFDPRRARAKEANQLKPTSALLLDFLEKSRLTCAISKFVNLHFLANPTYPRNPKTFGQKLRKKRMD